MVYKYTPRELLYIPVALLLFFQDYLQQSVGIMQFFDEFVTVFSLGLILMEALYKRLEKVHVKMLLLMGLLAGIGLISNMMAGIQTEIKPILTDIGNTFKVFVTYIGASLYLKKVKCKDRILKTVLPYFHGFVIIVFVCMIFHEVGVITMGTDVRYGLKSFKFVSTGAGNFSFLFYTIVLVLTLEMRTFPSEFKWAYIVMALIVWTSTLRSRAIMYVFVYLMLYLIMIRQKIKLELNWRTGAVIIFILYLFSMDQIETYFFTKKTARAQLLQYGVHTMRRYFPLGAGFATYGTDAAVKYYSALYHEYGFNSVWGLAQGNALFAHDTYWPAIFGQLGFFGTGLMIYLIYTWCMDILNKSKGNKVGYFAAIFVVVTQVSSSIATATFFHYITVGLCVWIPLLFDESTEKKRAKP